MTGNEDKEREDTWWLYLDEVEETPASRPELVAMWLVIALAVVIVTVVIAIARSS